MKRLLLAILLGFAAWKGYTHLAGGSAPPGDGRQSGDSSEPAAFARDVSAASGATAFQCDGRTHCSQMRSRAEAVFFVRHCPGTKMDGDGDGEPCENDSRW